MSAAQPGSPAEEGLSPGSLRRYAEGLTRRYGDAYRVAAALELMGSLVRNVGFGLAVVFLVGVLAMMKDDSGRTAVAAWLGGLLGAALIAGVCYVLGVLISALGQMLRATLDAAVNGSPFLTDAQRASIMSLP